MNWIVVKAQDKTETQQVDPNTVEKVDDILTKFYNSLSGNQGEERDWKTFRSLFLSDARLIPSGKANQEGIFRVHAVSVEDFIVSSKEWFAENGFYHTEIFRKIDTYSHLTHVISTFESRYSPEEDAFSRGIYSFQLFHNEEEFKIVNVYWAEENDIYPIPPNFLPGSN